MKLQYIESSNIRTTNDLVSNINKGIKMFGLIVFTIEDIKDKTKEYNDNYGQPDDFNQGDPFIYCIHSELNRLNSL